MIEQFFENSIHRLTWLFLKCYNSELPKIFNAATNQQSYVTKCWYGIASAMLFFYITKN